MLARLPWIASVKPVASEVAEEDPLTMLGRINVEQTIDVVKRMLNERAEMRLIVSIWYAAGGDDSVLRDNHKETLAEFDLFDNGHTTPNLFSALWYAERNGNRQKLQMIFKPGE